MIQRLTDVTIKDPPSGSNDTLNSLNAIGTLGIIQRGVGAARLAADSGKWWTLVMCCICFGQEAKKRNCTRAFCAFMKRSLCSKERNTKRGPIVSLKKKFNSLEETSSGRHFFILKVRLTFTGTLFALPSILLCLMKF